MSGSRQRESLNLPNQSHNYQARVGNNSGGRGGEPCLFAAALPASKTLRITPCQQSILRNANVIGQVVSVNEVH